MKLALDNVRVFDGSAIIGPTTVIIDGSVIGPIGNSVDVAVDQRIDCNEATLLPGFIDAHVHLTDKSQLLQMAAAGITTALDMGNFDAEQFNSFRDLPGLPDVRTSGFAATTANSRHSMLGFPKDKLVSDAESATKWTEDRVSENVDYVKIIADVPGPDQATLDAITTTAHKHQKLVVAHAASEEAYVMAVTAGVDVLTHVPLDKPLTVDTITQMVARKQVAVPTLIMMRGLSIIPRLSYKVAAESVTALHRAGIPIMAGTDANQLLPPMRVRHGQSMHTELELLVAAELSPVEALRGATVLPALHFGLTDRGVIETGKRADLVLVEGDPSVSIGATRNVLRVWCAGVEFINNKSGDLGLGRCHVL
ncbi:putative hydrolase [Cladochytrium replicatum]|nr:putative hydrolase [Cladochytrium replicatum]